MMIPILKFLILACAFSVFLLSAPVSQANPELASDEEISWVLLNFPPLMRLKLNREGETNIQDASGPMAELQRELVKALPQYRHRYIVVSYMRAKKLFESKQGYCTILFLANRERNEYLYFGETIASTIPPGLITNKKNESLLKISPQNSLVDLKQLLQNQNFTLGIVSGRSFSQKIDDALVESKKPIFRVVVNEAMGNLFKMLNSQRVDGVLAYYLELAEEQERNPESRDLRFYPLRQDFTNISLPVSCEKSPWGKKTLNRISVAIKDETVKQKMSALVKQTLLMEPPKRSEEPPAILR